MGSDEGIRIENGDGTVGRLNPVSGHTMPTSEKSYYGEPRSTPENFYIRSRDESVLDAITDADMLARKIPMMSDQFQAIRSLQDRYWDLRTPSSNGDIIGGAGGMKHIASIPKNVWLTAEAREPDLASNPAKFHAWLRRNPEYSTRKHG